MEPWTEDREFGVRRPDGVLVEAASEAEAMALYDAAPRKDWTVVSRQVEHGPWEEW